MMHVFAFCGSVQLFVCYWVISRPRDWVRAPNCFSPIFHLHASYTKKMCGDKPGGHQSELLSGGDGAQISAPKLAHFSIQGLTKFKIYR